MGFFDDLKKNAVDAAEKVAEKSSELIETGKLNLSIKSEEEKISRLFEEIGKALYDDYKSGNVVDSVFQEKMKIIDEKYGIIESYKAKIEEK